MPANFEEPPYAAIAGPGDCFGSLRMNRTLRRLMDTRPDYAPTIARLALGIMIWPHGLQKVFGVFGGAGFSGTMQFFTEGAGIPWIFALAAILAEFLGGIALLTGLFARVGAAAVGI